MKSTCLRRSTSFTFLLTGPLLTALPAFAGNLVLNATGGTFTMGSGVGSIVSLTGATTTSPAGSISFSCTISSIGGTYPVAYGCTGGSFTFASNDGSTTVSGAFTTADVDEWISGGGRGGQTHYSYEFLGPFSGVETLNGVSAAVNGEMVLSIGTFTSPLGSTTAGASTTGVNWDYTPLYVADYSFSRIIRVDDLFGTNELSFGSTGTGINQFYGTSGIALDSSGRIYIGDLYNA